MMRNLIKILILVGLASCSNSGQPTKRINGLEGTDQTTSGDQAGSAIQDNSHPAAADKATDTKPKEADNPKKSPLLKFVKLKKAFRIPPRCCAFQNAWISRECKNYDLSLCPTD
jgi:hypothetical protein